MPASRIGRCAAFALSRIAASVSFVSVGLQAAQHVVGAEFDDQRVGVGRNRPVVAREAVLGGVARDAGVDHRDVKTLGSQRRLELVGKALPGGRP